MKIIGEDLKKFREDKGFTQSEIAEFVGVSLRTIQNYESGGVIPQSKYEILHRLFNMKDPSSFKSAVGEFFSKMSINESPVSYSNKKKEDKGDARFEEVVASKVIEGLEAKIKSIGEYHKMVLLEIAKLAIGNEKIQLRIEMLEEKLVEEAEDIRSHIK